MPRPRRYPALPPISPAPLALISSPPYYYRPRALPPSPAHTRSLLLAAARPRYRVPYTALSPNPRPLSLVLKLATAPRELGPLRLHPSNYHLHPNPRSATLERCPPPSFAKVCPCPISRRCGIWRPPAPLPGIPSVYARIDPARLARVLYPEPRKLPLGPPGPVRINHALRRSQMRP